MRLARQNQHVSTTAGVAIAARRGEAGGPAADHHEVGMAHAGRSQRSSRYCGSVTESG